MPTQVGDHFLYSKQLARNNYVLWIEGANGTILETCWIDHKPSEKELSEIAERLYRQSVNTNPSEKYVMDKFTEDHLYKWACEYITNDEDDSLRFRDDVKAFLENMDKEDAIHLINEGWTRVSDVYGVYNKHGGKYRR